MAKRLRRRSAPTVHNERLMDDPLALRLLILIGC
jgi:hypothetical protein